MVTNVGRDIVELIVSKMLSKPYHKIWELSVYTYSAYGNHIGVWLCNHTIPPTISLGMIYGTIVAYINFHPIQNIMSDDITHHSYDVLMIMYRSYSW